jgi:hypothetical protein
MHTCTYHHLPQRTLPNPFPVTVMSTFVIRQHVIIVSKPLQSAFFLGRIAQGKALLPPTNLLTVYQALFAITPPGQNVGYIWWGVRKIEQCDSIDLRLSYSIHHHTPSVQYPASHSMWLDPLATLMNARKHVQTRAQRMPIFSPYRSCHPSGE